MFVSVFGFKYVRNLKINSGLHLASSGDGLEKLHHRTSAHENNEQNHHPDAKRIPIKHKTF
jgi:hypothetical protein